MLTGVIAIGGQGYEDDAKICYSRVFYFIPNHNECVDLYHEILEIAESQHK